jgi:hypothetical protein
MPPLSEGIAALAQLFGDAHRLGHGLTLTPLQVEMVSAALNWLDQEIDDMRARIRALEIEIACLDAVGRELELPLNELRQARALDEEALLDAIAAGKVIPLAMIPRPAFCDGSRDASA